MPAGRTLKSAAGIFPFCHQKAGISSREHPECRRTCQAGWNKVVNLASEARRSHNFDEKILQLTLAEIAHRSFEDGTTVNQALEDSWKQGMDHAHGRPDHDPSRGCKLREFGNRTAPDTTQTTRCQPAIQADLL